MGTVVVGSDAGGSVTGGSDSGGSDAGGEGAVVCSGTVAAVVASPSPNIKRLLPWPEVTVRLLTT